MWITSRGRGDLCLEMGIEMGIERESNKSEKWVKRESVYIKGS